MSPSSLNEAYLLDTEISDIEISLLTRRPTVKIDLDPKLIIWTALDGQSMSDSRIM